ncbi:hypothetical protein [Streptomyces sp. DSM 15324]|uniref:hypothetical protein n=1 Tax=Streptomyces sp. DSM 15324 TaxID=1739111 RepID=UPI00074785DC|nr:hypothetical protein [Streptomyces sp. DSM 15324]KUO11840.1 hypothetical protein AQJ58_11805 [Streptomyces sp. DSM 15324]
MVSTLWQIAGAVGGLGTVLFLADRVLLWMEARGWIYWRKQKGLSSIGVDFLQGITPGAQAGKRALEQERARKNVRPAEEPPFQVDLEAGTVRVRRTGQGGGRGQQ